MVLDQLSDGSQAAPPAQNVATSSFLNVYLALHWHVTGDARWVGNLLG